MPNEHEIRDAVHLASLDILGLGRLLNAAHTKLLMRHFDDAKVNLEALITWSNKIIMAIPEEPGK